MRKLWDAFIKAITAYTKPFDSQMGISSSHTVSDPKNIREWHLSWLITHPILFIKNLVYNHDYFFIMAIGVLLACALIIFGVFANNPSSIVGLAIILFILYAIFAPSHKDDDEE